MFLIISHICYNMNKTTSSISASVDRSNKYMINWNRSLNAELPMHCTYMMLTCNRSFIYVNLIALGMTIPSWYGLSRLIPNSNHCLSLLRHPYWLVPSTIKDETKQSEREEVLRRDDRWFNALFIVSLREIDATRKNMKFSPLNFPENRLQIWITSKIYSRLNRPCY